MITTKVEKSVPDENNLQSAAFQVAEADHTLEIVDRKSTTFRSEHIFKLIAQIPSRFFVREYFWTGSGSEKEPVPDLVTDIDTWGFPFQKIHGPLLMQGEARILVVDLGRTISAGEAVNVHFRHRMKDLKGTFKPLFLVRPSKQIRNRIGLRLVLPAWEGLQVVYDRFRHDSEEVEASSVLPPVEASPGRLTFEKEIFNPDDEMMGHKLSWTHAEVVS